MKTRSMIASLAGMGLLLAATAASAGNACIKDAKAELKDCHAGCVEDFQSAKDACLNRDHNCVEACRDGRQQCIDSSGLKQAFDQCQSQLDDAKASCRQQFPAGSTDRDNCIDQAQVVAFECRQHARQQFGPAVKACKAGFRSCARACPPGQGSVDDPATCRKNANTDYKACQSGCVEDYQVAKDACLNRDHVCVDGCRDARQTCRQPVQQQLDGAIDQCNSDRDAAIANCKSLYPDGSQAQADCIENARVTAFECRDQARENAAPGFQNCRANFKTCVQACPPPSSGS